MSSATQPRARAAPPDVAGDAALSLTGPAVAMPSAAAHGGALLAIDTATATAVVALGDPTGALLDEVGWTAGYRHGEELLARVDALLVRNGTPLAGIGAIVVGTGPGAFTGLRVGLATAKALAHALDRPIVGISTGRALLASPAATEGASASPAALLLPAGPTDRVVVLPDGRAELLPGGTEPDLAPGTTIVAVDLEGRAPAVACARGEAARKDLGVSLLRLGSARLAEGSTDDAAELVPEYVTLPRGIRASGGEVRWSRAPR